MRRGRSCSRITRTRVRKERGEGRWVRWWFPGAQPELRSELLVTSPPFPRGTGYSRAALRPVAGRRCRERASSGAAAGSRERRMAECGSSEAEDGRGRPIAHEPRIAAGTCRAPRKSNSLSLAPGAASALRDRISCEEEAQIWCVGRIRIEHRKEHRIERERERKRGRKEKGEREKGSRSLRGGPEWTVVEFPSASIYPLLRGSMTAAREERNRLWIRMSPCLLANSPRHVAPALPFLWIFVILLNGE